eukprot:TRINITY_DN46408_c0_g1_i1.p1 TRINITY_DN46408_c0_g1~~TRINITY_DN46408_c0_g1_i1.p1  ORF type:complete len:265 (-),score=64.31 TRINITY_DN46408_c0_g1_i1:499-1293(-)
MRHYVVTLHSSPEDAKCSGREGDPARRRRTWLAFLFILLAVAILLTVDVQHARSQAVISRHARVDHGGAALAHAAVAQSSGQAVSWRARLRNVSAALAGAKGPQAKLRELEEMKAAEDEAARTAKLQLAAEAEAEAERKKQAAEEEERQRREAAEAAALKEVRAEEEEALRKRRLEAKRPLNRFEERRVRRRVRSANVGRVKLPELEDFRSRLRPDVKGQLDDAVQFFSETTRVPATLIGSAALGMLFLPTWPCLCALLPTVSF